MYAFRVGGYTYPYLRGATPAEGLRVWNTIKASPAIRKRPIVGKPTCNTCQPIINAVAIVKGCSSPNVLQKNLFKSPTICYNIYRRIIILLSRAVMTLVQRTEDVLSMVLVMGITGAGKSYFINKLAGGEVARTGADLRSCTALLIYYSIKTM